MKKVLFTAILLLVLGTAWMLYLDYDYRRFIEHLPKAPTTVTQPVHTADANDPPQSSETIATGPSPLETESETEVTDMFTESAPVQPHQHPHTSGTEQTEPADFPHETRGFENDFQEVDEGPPKRSAKQFLMEELGVSEAEIERRKLYIKELNRLFWEKPENWVKGRPDEVGFVFEIWTIEDANTIRRAAGLPPLSPDSPELQMSAEEPPRP